MKALFITMRKILPLNDGAFIYTYGILRFLKEQNIDISFVSFYENEPYSKNEKEQLMTLCSDIDNVKLNWKSTALNMSLRYPNNVRKYTRPAMKKLIKRKKDENQFDLIVIDHLQMFEYASLFQTGRIVLIEHNVESNIWKDYASKCHGLVKLLVQRSADMTFDYEKKAIGRANAVISIAESDYKCLKEMNSNANIAVMHPYNVYPLVKTDEDVLSVTHKIVFIGSYGWYPNQEAARFLVEDVMPQLRKHVPNVKLYLVGKSPTQQMIKYHEQYSDVIVTGIVDSVDPYIKECDVFVNAMFNGSGMNIKMMEAMGKGIPVITSSFGCRGISIQNGKQAFIFETAEECISYIQHMMENRELALNMAQNARKFYLDFIQPDEEVRNIFMGVE